MRLSPDVVNGQVDALAARLNGGSLVYYTGTRPAAAADALELQTELVRVALPSPAFQKANAGQAIGFDLEPAPIAVTGEARWYQLLTASGSVVADGLARRKDEPDAGQADAILDRTDFHRGGLFHSPPPVLRLPASS